MQKKLRAQDITFILVRPRYPGNIGSTARILKNMGFSKFSVVLPTVLPTHPESYRLAVGAADLLKKAKVYDSIEAATQGMRFLIGTSRRIGKYRRDFVNLPELDARIPLKQKIGILFGAEERGLTNRELSCCHLVTMIPTNPDFPSLNLAQAVAVVSYQLRLAIDSGAAMEKPPLPLASVEEIEGMYRHLEKMLVEINFLKNDNSFHMMRTLRSLLGRTGLTEREVRIIRGICRQVLWYDRIRHDTEPKQQTKDHGDRR